MTETITETLYTANVTAEGGRDGHARSDDGRLDVRLSPPTDEASGDGTNPEQLFAAGYAACFQSALAHVASGEEIDTSNSRIDASVALGTTTDEHFALAVTMRVALPGLDRATAQRLIDAAHETCPYARATRGNIETTISVA